MEFEFDPRKSESNKKKHGIDFNEAQALWDDPGVIEIPVRTSDESRFLVIGKISGKRWSGVITYRKGRQESFRFGVPGKRRLISMKASEFDKKFDEGKDISKYLELSKARRHGQEQKRVNVDFPLWMVQMLDREAKRLGVPRQAIIKVWVAERLEKAG